MGASEKTGLVAKNPAKEYDPSANGPIKNRSCTDVICCILFVICILGMGACSFLGFTRGDPVRLLYPTDSNGSLCGYGDKVDKPNLFFFDLYECAKLGPGVVVAGCPTPQVCVASCPNISFAWPEVLVDNSLRKQMICQPSINAEFSSQSVQALVEDDDCAAYYVKSSPLVGRCIPAILNTIANKAAGIVASNNATTLVDKYNNTVTGTKLEEGSKYLAIFLNAKEYGVQIYQDVRASWWMIIVGLVISMIISFIFIIIMRWIAGIMVWVTIVIFFALFGFATYYSFDKYFTMKDMPGTDGNFVFTTNLSYYWNLSNTWLAFGIIAASFLVIILLIVIFLRSRIMTAIALIKETSRAIGNMVFTLFWPLIPFVLQVILFGYWGATAIYLASSGTSMGMVYNTTNTTMNRTDGGGNVVVEKVQSVINEIPCDPNANGTAGSVCSFVKYGGDEYTMYLQIYMLFMLFWCMNFIVALGQMTLAGAFASYYWAFKKPDDIPAFPVTASLWRSLRYHMGSLAFGSLIIAIIQLIRVFLEYLDAKLKGSENPVAKFFLKCLKCFFWCLEKFMKFINKNAYILIAVYGKNFCTSAKNAFSLILRNVVRVAVVDKVTDFLLFICKLVVVAATGVAAFFFFDGRITFLSNYVPTLNFYLVPVIVITIGAYVIASGFFSVYGMGVDTLFLCFLEDLERHDGSPEKPFFMNKELKSILGKKNQKVTPEKDEKTKE